MDSRRQGYLPNKKKGGGIFMMDASVVGKFMVKQVTREEGGGRREEVRGKR